MTKNNPEIIQLPEKFNDPERYRLLESGAVMDKTTGKLVGNIGGGKYAITSQNTPRVVMREPLSKP